MCDPNNNAETKNMFEKLKSEKDHGANEGTIFLHRPPERDRIGGGLEAVIVAGAMFAICVMLHRMDVDGSCCNLGFLVSSIVVLTTGAITLALVLVEVCRDVFRGVVKRFLARPAVRSFLREHEFAPILITIVGFFGACWANITGLCALWDGVVSDPGGSALLLAWTFSVTALSVVAACAGALFLVALPMIGSYFQEVVDDEA